MFGRLVIPAPPAPASGRPQRENSIGPVAGAPRASRERAAARVAGPGGFSCPWCLVAIWYIGCNSFLLERHPTSFVLVNTSENMSMHSFWQSIVKQPLSWRPTHSNPPWCTRRFLPCAQHVNLVPMEAQIMIRYSTTIQQDTRILLGIPPLRKTGVPMVLIFVLEDFAGCMFCVSAKVFSPRWAWHQQP